MVSTTRSISRLRRPCRLMLKVLCLALLFFRRGKYMFFSLLLVCTSDSAQVLVLTQSYGQCPFFILPIPTTVFRNASVVGEFGSQPKRSHQKVVPVFEQLLCSFNTNSGTISNQHLKVVDFILPLQADNWCGQGAGGGASHNRRYDEDVAWT